MTSHCLHPLDFGLHCVSGNLIKHAAANGRVFEGNVTSCTVLARIMQQVKAFTKLRLTCHLR